MRPGALEEDSDRFHVGMQVSTNGCRYVIKKTERKALDEGTFPTARGLTLDCITPIGIAARSSGLPEETAAEGHHQYFLVYKITQECRAWNDERENVQIRKTCKFIPSYNHESIRARRSEYEPKKPKTLILYASGVLSYFGYSKLGGKKTIGQVPERSGKGEIINIRNPRRRRFTIRIRTGWLIWLATRRRLKRGKFW